MNNEEMYNKLKEYFDKWSWIAEHWGWKFGLKTCECYEDMPNDADENTVAITYCDYPYLRGDIFFNLKRLQEKQESEIEEIVIHELCHFLVSPMQRDVEDVEISVTMIARSLKGLNDAK